MLISPYHTLPRLESLDHKLTDEQKLRLKDYYKNLNAYEGYHFENKPVEHDDDGLPIQDDGSEVTVNFVRRFVQKLVRFILGDKAFSIDAANQKYQEITVPYLNKIWDKNNRKTLSTSMMNSGSVFGDVYVVIEPSMRLLADKLRDEKKARRIKESLTIDELLEPDFVLRAIPATNGFPYYKENRKRPLSEMLMFEYKEVRPKPPQKVIQEAYPDKNPADRAILRYVDKLTNKGKNPLLKESEDAKNHYLYQRKYYTDRIEEWVNDQKLETYELGYDLVTVVHIPNKIKSTETPYGDNDIDDVIPLNYELNYKASDVSEIINYYQSPLTIFFGVGLQSIEKGDDRMLTGLPKDAKVQNLEMKGDLVASQNYIGFLKESMLEIFGITQTSLTGQTSISNTSGVALHMQYEPLMERKQEKTTYLDGIAKINTYILYLAIFYGRLPTVKYANPRDAIIQEPELFETTVTFPNTLPKDDLLVIQKGRSKIEAGLGTREDVLRELGETDPITKLQEIEADRMNVLKLTLIESLLMNIAKDGIDAQAFETLKSSNEFKESGFATGILNDPMINMLMKINNKEQTEVKEVDGQRRTAEMTARTGTREMKQARNQTQAR